MNKQKRMRIDLSRKCCKSKSHFRNKQKVRRYDNKGIHNNVQAFKKKWQNDKQKELIEKFHEWNGSPAPIFEIVEIDEALINDINDDINDYEMEIL